MADYRRFVAYVYEYQKEKKGNNCGFVRVEQKEGRCRVELHLQCPGLVAESECLVYGFVRKNELLEGILIGSCMTKENRAECVLDTSSEKVGGQNCSLAELGGMIFTTDAGGFFGTEWDDLPICPKDFCLKNDEGETEKESQKEQEKKMEEESYPKEEEVIQDVHSQSITDTEVSTANFPSDPPPPPRPMPVGTPAEVFGDGELTECRKILPQDLCRLGRRECMLRNNRFLQHGYYNFGHLLLCRNHCGQYVLGVPGVYDQQERFMANMFGFPWFKESEQIKIPGGKGGYWYRLIDPSDSDNRNRC